jgi:hypothetical protein
VFPLKGVSDVTCIPLIRKASYMGIIDSLAKLFKLTALAIAFVILKSFTDILLLSNKIFNVD